MDYPLSPVICFLHYHKKKHSATIQNKIIDKPGLLGYIFSSHRITLTKHPVLLQNPAY
jgi:hypothetical protein